MSDEGIAGGSVGGGGDSSLSGGDGSSYQAGLDQAVSTVIQHQSGGNEKQEMEDFAAEYKYQQAKDRGEKIDDETRNERSERLRRAMDTARSENAELRGESQPETYQPNDDQWQSSDDDSLPYEDTLRKQGANKVRFEEIRATSPEFVDLALSNYEVIPLRPDITSMIQAHCDSPMDVAVLIGTDPDAIAELNAMSKKEARKWINKFDARVAVARSQPQQPQHSIARHQTNAPPPLRTPRGGAGAPVNDRTGPDDMGSFAKWLRQKQAKGK